jgi:NDP-sugar pyrophosphorylase family protein
MRVRSWFHLLVLRSSEESVMLVGIIPCAGYGTRLSPITETMPKGLVRIGSKTLLEHNLTIMKDLDISRIVLVISAHTERIRSYVGQCFEGIAVDYVIQEPPRGLLDAIYQARKAVEDRFLTLLADEVYVGCHHKGLVEYWEERPSLGGLVGYVMATDPEEIKKNYSILATGARIEHLEEKPRMPVNAMLGTGTWALDRAFFDYADFALTKNPPEKRNFVDALQLMIDDDGLIEGYDLAGGYVNVNSPVDILRAKALLDSQDAINT